MSDKRSKLEKVRCKENFKISKNMNIKTKSINLPKKLKPKNL